MNTLIITDTHKTIEELQETGITKAQAERIVSTIQKAELRSEPATKTDLNILRVEIYKAMTLQTLAIIGALTGIMALFF